MLLRTIVMNQTHFRCKQLLTKVLERGGGVPLLAKTIALRCLCECGGGGVVGEWVHPWSRTRVHIQAYAHTCTTHAQYFNTHCTHARMHARTQSKDRGCIRVHRHRGEGPWGGTCARACVCMWCVHACVCVCVRVWKHVCGMFLSRRSRAWYLSHLVLASDVYLPAYLPTYLPLHTRARTHTNRWTCPLNSYGRHRS